MLESHWLRAEKYVRSHVLGLRLHFCSFSCKVNQRTSCLYQESVFCLWLFHCCVLLTPHPTWLPFSQNPLVIINIFISKKKKKKISMKLILCIFRPGDIFVYVIFSSVIKTERYPTHLFLFVLFPWRWRSSGPGDLFPSVSLKALDVMAEGEFSSSVRRRQTDKQTLK